VPLDGTESPAVQGWLPACIMFAMVANWMTKATTLSLLPVFTIQPTHNLLEWFTSVYSRKYIPLMNVAVENQILLCN